MEKKKLFSIDEINSLLAESYTCGYNSAKLFYEPQLQTKKENELKEKLFKKFLKKVKKK